jgi:WD40 repeat protein
VVDKAQRNLCPIPVADLENRPINYLAKKPFAMSAIAIVVLMLPHASGKAACQTRTIDRIEKSAQYSDAAANINLAKISLVRTIGPTDKSHTDRIKNVRLVGDNQAISCAADGTVCLWNLESQELIRRFVDEKAKTIYCITLTADKRFVIAGGDGKRIVRWDLESGELVRSYPCDSSVYSIDMCPDGETFVTGDASGTATRWKLDDEKSSSQYQIDGDDITALKCLGDGSGFATGNSAGEVRVWKFDAEKPAQKFRGLDTWVCCLQLSDDQQKLVGCDYGGDMVLWDLNTQKQVWRRSNIASEISWLRFLNQEKLIAVSGNNQLISIVSESGKVKKFEIDMPDIGGFDFGQDRKSVFCAGKNAICGWDLAGNRIYPDDDAYQQSQPISKLVVHNNVAYSVGDRPALTGRDLKTGEVVFESDFQDLFKTNPDETSDLIRSGDRIVVLYSDSYVLVDLTSDQAKPKLQKCTLSGISISPNPMKLIGLDSKRQKVIEFDPEKPNKNRTLMTFPVEDSKLAWLDDRFAIRYSEQSIGILSLDRARQIRERAWESFSVELIAGKGGLIVATNGKKLIGFSSLGLAPTPPVKQAEFEYLIGQLSSQQFELRENATMLLAGGGQAILDQLDSVSVDNVEAKSRLAKIRELIGNRGIPDLNQMATADFKGPFETVAVHPSGMFWLATVRRNWKSELIGGRVEKGQFKIDLKMPLRSRATAIEFTLDAKEVVLGYADGSIDVMKVESE